MSTSEINRSQIVTAADLGDLDVGAVHGADDEAAVHGELHVGGARSLRARRADVLAQLRARDEHLRQVHVVVRHKHNLRRAHDRECRCLKIDVQTGRM